MVALYGAAVVVFSDMYITQPILPLLSQEFGVTPATAGLSVSAVVLLIALASTSYGPLSDLVGRKPVMVGSCALLAVPTVLCAFAPTFTLLLLGRALQGLCIPGLTAVAVAYLGDIVEPRALGRSVGAWIAANVAGGLASRVVSGILTDLFDWHTPFLVFGVLTLLCAIWMALTLPADQPPARGGGWLPAYRGMLAHLGNRQLAGAFLIGGALFFGFIAIFTYLPYYLTAAPFFLSPALVAFAYVSYLAGVIVSPLAGQLSNRYPRRLIIAIGLLIALVGIGLTLLPTLPVIVLSLFVLCTGMFTAQATAPALVNALARTNKGGAGALYLMSYYLGGTLGAALPGLAWQRFGWWGVVGASATAMVVALLADWLLCQEERSR
jgi:YNFM family putative membrane transporter